jgi:hypothetical protein
VRVEKEYYKRGKTKMKQTNETKEDKIVFLVRHTNAIEKDNEDNNTTYLDYTSKIHETETTLSKAKERKRQ